MAVAFDWGLAVQMLLTPVLSIFLGSPFFSKRAGLDPKVTIIISFLIFWPIAVLFALFGDGIRRGVRWTRPVQIAANTLGFLGGFGVLIQLWQGSQKGNYWVLGGEGILVFFSPFIAWRTGPPEEASGVCSVTDARDSDRHSGALSG